MSKKKKKKTPIAEAHWEVLPNNKKGSKDFKKKLKEKTELMRSNKTKKAKEAKKKKRPEKVVYGPHQCEFIKKNKKQCKKGAVGSGVLCEKHGGTAYIPENNLPAECFTDKMLKLSKFNPAIHPIEYIAYSQSGLSKVQIAAKFGVSISTIDNWTQQFQEMRVATDAGKSAYEAYWLQIGHDNLTNTRFNTNLYKFITGNKLGYSDKQETKNFNANVHGVLVVPGQCTPEQWEEEAKRARQEDKIFEAEYEELVDD